MKICPACSREYPEEAARCEADGSILVSLATGAGRAENMVGQVVDGRYRIDGILGKGGMGTVYACTHVVVGKKAAIKVLRAGVERSEEVLQRFIREAQAANAIRSRHIVEMSDFGQLPNGSFYMVMEQLEGDSFSKAMRGGLSPRQLLHIFIQIADALFHAHSAGVVHRDLKPDNVVLVHVDSDPLFVKLLDFGIAKLQHQEASQLTETGVILGTPYYMSPEQARAQRVDHRSDIYSVGVMMYRAFTGRLPFLADSTMGVLTAHLTEVPELPSRICSLDAPTEKVILRCLEKKPEDRFQSMEELSLALKAILSPDAHPTLQDPVSVDYDSRSDGHPAAAPRAEDASASGVSYSTPGAVHPSYSQSQASSQSSHTPSSGVAAASIQTGPNGLPVMQHPNETGTGVSASVSAASNTYHTPGSRRATLMISGGIAALVGGALAAVVLVGMPKDDAPPSSGGEGGGAKAAQPASTTELAEVEPTPTPSSGSGQPRIAPKPTDASPAETSASVTPPPASPPAPSPPPKGPPTWPPPPPAQPTAEPSAAPPPPPPPPPKTVPTSGDVRSPF